MRILFINSLYLPDIGGGAEITLASIVRGMRARGHETAVITTHGGKGLRTDVVDGTEVFRLGFRNLYWHHMEDRERAWKRVLWHSLDSYNPHTARAARSVIEGFSPDIISCHNLMGLSSSIWNAAAPSGGKIVQILHDYYGICPKVTMFREGKVCSRQCVGCAMLRIPLRFASNRVDAVVGVSRAVLDTHLNAGLFKRAEFQQVIHNARTITEPDLPLRQRDSSRPFVVGFIGTLSDVKGVETLAETFERVTARIGRSAILLIGGTGKSAYVKALKARYESDRIQFLGRVNPRDFFSRLDVSVVPSVWNDPFPGVVFESLGSGVPVIATTRGGIPEVVRHEENGLLYDPSDSGALEHALTQVMGNWDMVSRMAACSRSSVAHLLDIERMLDQYEALFDQVLCNPHQTCMTV